MKGLKSFFSKAGQAFMLPIALLPAAGMLLGIGDSFTNETFLEQYPNLIFLQQGKLKGQRPCSTQRRATPCVKRADGLVETRHALSP